MIRFSGVNVRWRPLARRIRQDRCCGTRLISPLELSRCARMHSADPSVASLRASAAVSHRHRTAHGERGPLSLRFPWLCSLLKVHESHRAGRLRWNASRLLSHLLRTLEVEEDAVFALEALAL